MFAPVWPLIPRCSIKIVPCSSFFILLSPSPAPLSSFSCSAPVSPVLRLCLLLFLNLHLVPNSQQWYVRITARMQQPQQDKRTELWDRCETAKIQKRVGVSGGCDEGCGMWRWYMYNQKTNHHEHTSCTRVPSTLSPMMDTTPCRRCVATKICTLYRSAGS